MRDDRPILAEDRDKVCSPSSDDKNCDSVTPPMRDPYDEFVEQSPQGIFYCKRWWLDAVSPGRYEILTVEKKGTIKAAWPLVFKEAGDRSRITMPQLTQKLGVLLAPSQAKYAERLSSEHRLIEKLIQNLPDGVRVVQKFHENFTNWLPFYWNGYEQTTRYTYILGDLTDTNEIWLGLREAERRAVRKAKKEGISIVETEDLEHFYEINRLSFERQGMKIPYSIELVARITTALKKNAGLRMLFAKDSQKRIHACDFLAYDDRCAVSLLGGGNPELRNSGGQAAAEWESIVFASNVSQRFDFEGSMIPGVERFMRGFGAVQTPYFSISGARNESKNSQKKNHGRLRQLAGRMLRKTAHLIDPK